MNTLAREPPTRRFCSTTATTTRGLTSGCQPKRRLASKQLRRVASRFYSTSTMAAVTASATREPNRFAVQRMYSLLCSGSSAIRSFSRQNRNRNQTTSSPAFFLATANTEKRLLSDLSTRANLTGPPLAGTSHLLPAWDVLRLRPLVLRHFIDCFVTESLFCRLQAWARTATSSIPKSRICSALVLPLGSGRYSVGCSPPHDFQTGLDQ